MFISNHKVIHYDYNKSPPTSSPSTSWYIMITFEHPFFAVNEASGSTTDTAFSTVEEVVEENDTFITKATKGTEQHGGASLGESSVPAWLKAVSAKVCALFASHLQAKYVILMDC